MTVKRKVPSEPASHSARVLLAKRLREWRKSHGFALKKVAVEFGVSEATWSRWEKGTRFPLPENIRLLAEFIDAPMCSFFYAGTQNCPPCLHPDGSRKKP
jgi:transcriptional regulator with XRE-family HTH domain